MHRTFDFPLTNTYLTTYSYCTTRYYCATMRKGHAVHVIWGRYQGLRGWIDDDAPAKKSNFIYVIFATDHHGDICRRVLKTSVQYILQ